MTKHDEQLLSIGEAAQRAGCSVGWLRYLTDTGALDCLRIGGRRAFKPADIDKVRAGLRKPKPRKRGKK